MDVRHLDNDLEKAEIDPKYRGSLDKERLRSYRKVMNLVRQAPNEGQLLRFRSLNYEKLKGDRSHEYSIRLNKQWRLIFEIEKRAGPNNNLFVVKALEDYHP